LLRAACRRSLDDQTAVWGRRRRLLGLRRVVRAQLRDKLTDFYVDKRMWYRNAGANLGRLRVIGVPHQQVPALHDPLSCFQTAYKALSGTLARDNEALHAVSLLASGVRDVVDTYGDLFDQKTSPGIDLRVQAAALAAVLAQILARASEVGADPRTVVVHGARTLTAMNNRATESGQPLGVASWVTGEMDRLKAIGGRVVWSFADPRQVLAAAEITDLVGADYSLLSGLSESTLSAYAEMVGADPWPALVRLSAGANPEQVTVLKRGQSVVCFEPML
jgi:hypothetical protein